LDLGDFGARVEIAANRSKRKGPPATVGLFSFRSQVWGVKRPFFRMLPDGHGR
jgi:hypothetical protein